MTCRGTLVVPGTAGRTGWDVPLLDRAGRYEVVAHWFRTAGLPVRLPDGLGLALRVLDPLGADGPLDVSLTSCGTSRPLRHLPLPRRDALAGPYSTLLPYRVGDRPRVVAAFPGVTARRIPGDPAALRGALARKPVRMALCAAAPGEPWRAFAYLVLAEPEEPEEPGDPCEGGGAAVPDGAGGACEPLVPYGPPAAGGPLAGFDPRAHALPRLGPAGRTGRLRAAVRPGARNRRFWPPAPLVTRRLLPVPAKREG